MSMLLSRMRSMALQICVSAFASADVASDGMASAGNSAEGECSGGNQETGIKVSLHGNRFSASPGDETLLMTGDTNRRVLLCNIFRDLSLRLS
ncbi:uncharacterized protein V1518DRAFT_414372 [Limtongia smithiae]|uniref:uncharacterized protein n=1 Tax=Limtongia smithiae TaxID=1125753 RepID=UPI0034CF14DB